MLPNPLVPGWYRRKDGVEVLLIGWAGIDKTAFLGFVVCEDEFCYSDNNTFCADYRSDGRFGGRLDEREKWDLVEFIHGVDLSLKEIHKVEVEVKDIEMEI